MTKPSIELIDFGHYMRRRKRQRLAGFIKYHGLRALVLLGVWSLLTAVLRVTCKL